MKKNQLLVAALIVKMKEVNLSMKYSLSAETEKKIMILGLYQVAGAVLGIGLLFWMLIQMSQPGFSTVLFILAAYAFFIFGLVAGWRCIDLREGAMRLSRINQTLQVFGISIAGFTYSYTAGIAVGLRFEFFGDILLHYFFQLSTIKFSFGNQFGHSILTVNVIPILLVIWIDRIDRAIQRERHPLLDDRPGE